MGKRKRKPHNLVPREAKVYLQLRLPKSLHRSLRTEARRNKCSLHAEMLRRLASGERTERVDMLLEQVLAKLELIENRALTEEGYLGNRTPARSQTQVRPTPALWSLDPVDQR